MVIRISVCKTDLSYFLAAISAAVEDDERMEARTHVREMLLKIAARTFLVICHDESRDSSGFCDVRLTMSHTHDPPA